MKLQVNGIYRTRDGLRANVLSVTNDDPANTPWFDGLPVMAAKILSNGFTDRVYTMSLDGRVYNGEYDQWDIVSDENLGAMPVDRKLAVREN